MNIQYLSDFGSKDYGVHKMFEDVSVRIENANGDIVTPSVRMSLQQLYDRMNGLEKYKIFTPLGYKDFSLSKEGDNVRLTVYSSSSTFKSANLSVDTNSITGEGQIASAKQNPSMAVSHVTSGATNSQPALSTHIGYSSKNWIPDNLDEGSLRDHYHLKEGEKLPVDKVNADIKRLSAKAKSNGGPGLSDSELQLLRRLNLAKTFKSFNK